MRVFFLLTEERWRGMSKKSTEILTFWFEETAPQQWFQKDSAFDEAIRNRFELDYEQAAEGAYDSWREQRDSALALCLLLDQFPRNMYRDSPKAFVSDAYALDVARYAVAQGFDEQLPAVKARFLYLPFEHSEDLADQETSLTLFGKIKGDDPLGYDYAVQHYDVIKAYGRFPHRNAILGRASTDEELAYLAQDDAGF